VTLWISALCLVGCANPPSAPIRPDIGECNRADFDEPPKLISGPRPEYPFNLRRTGQQGAALVKYAVSRDGRTEIIEAKSPHSRLFVDEAIGAVSEWMFAPALKNKSPVGTSCTTIFIFRLEG
jgi:outer membrane biosynthesis protein TonB